jgi:hypothetical protein
MEPCLGKCADKVWPATLQQRKEKQKMPVLKLKQYPGVQLIADETVEAHNTEQALRASQYELDVKLHDLRTEFLARESKLRSEHLDRVAAIVAA